VRASLRIADRGIPHVVVYMFEPGRFRAPRTTAEAAHAASPDLVERSYPSDVAPRVFVTHTRSEVILGICTLCILVRQPPGSASSIMVARSMSAACSS
jgi:hypothetical protein